MRNDECAIGSYERGSFIIPHSSLRSLDPTRQRFNALHPGLDGGIVLELETAFGRNRDVRVAREIGNRGTTQREPVVAPESSLQHREALFTITLVLLDVALLDLVIDASRPLQAVVKLVVGQREPLRDF